jgi:hypothetical protein
VGSPEAAQSSRTPGSVGPSPELFAIAAIAVAIGSVAENLDVGTLVITLAMLVAGIALFASHHVRPFASPTLINLLSIGIVAGLAMSVLNPPVPDPAYRLALVGVGIVAVWTVRYAEGWIRIAGIAGAVTGHLGLMVTALAATQPPLIDVIQFQQEGAQALVAGENPYALRFLNIYGPDTPYYAPEVLAGDRVTFGFPYPPLSLLLAVPGYLVAGDFRFGAAAAMSMTALLIAFARSTRAAAGAAFVFLLAPPVWTVVYNGWSEAFVVPLVALTVYLAVRQSRLVPVSLGLLIGAKQYLAPLLLVGSLLLRRPGSRQAMLSLIVTSSAVALLTTLPFLLWHPESFIYSTVTFHGLQPFRTDALSWPSLAVRHGLPEAPSWFGFAGGGAMLAAVLWKAPRTPAGFSAGCALVLLLFFLLGKQAFVNYYLVVLCALASAIAALELQLSRQSAWLSPPELPEPSSLARASRMSSARAPTAHPTDRPILPVLPARCRQLGRGCTHSDAPTPYTVARATRTR